MRKTKTGRQEPGSGSRRLRVAAACAAGAAAVLGFVLFMNVDDGRSPAAVVSPSPSATGQAPEAPESAPAAGTAGPTEPVTGSSSAPDPGKPESGTGPEADQVPGPAAAGDAELATQDRAVAAPVEIATGSSADAGIDIRVTGMEAVDGEAEGIGEVAGPAVRFTVSVTNNSGKPVDLASAVMTVEAGADKAPCTQLSGPQAEPLPIAVESGQTVTGSYVFLVPVEIRDLVTVYLSYSVDAPVAAFEGEVPTP